MVDISEVYGGDSLTAANLKGREVTVVIESTEERQFTEGNKLVIRFQGKEKYLVCNKTNAHAIAEIYGTESNQWVGKEITLYPTRTDFRGKMVDAIRVKAPQKRFAAPARSAGRAQQQIQNRDGYQLSTAVPPDGLDEVLPPDIDDFR